jgi:N-formylmaleamate deformylase
MSSACSVSPQEGTVPGSVPIHFAIHEGEGPALILIHGITGSGDVWLPIIGPLSQHVTPVAVDLRGHGRSGKPDQGYLYHHYIDDLDRVLDALQLDRPLILGHSLGGLVALWWAARHPDRAAALVIEDSPLRSGKAFLPAFDNWMRLNRMPVAELRSYYEQEHPTWRPEDAQRRAEQMTATASAVISELRQDSLANDGVDRIAEIEHIQSPVLLIRGDPETGSMVRPDDAIAFQRRLPNATSARISDGSHSLHLDRMGDFLGHAVPFLLLNASTASHLPEGAMVSR